MNKTELTTEWAGDTARYTGKTATFMDLLLYEVEMMDGPYIGQIFTIPRSPADEEARRSQIKDFRAQIEARANELAA